MSLLVKWDSTYRCLAVDIDIQLIACMDGVGIGGQNLLGTVALGITYIRHFSRCTAGAEACYNKYDKRIYDTIHLKLISLFKFS